MAVTGRVWKFGVNVDTDVVLPGRFCNIIDPAELKKVVFADVRPEFAKEVKPGDILIAGSNFGCGSSREVAPLGLKSAGLSCVISSGFARIFYRNCINIGFPIMEAPGVWDDVADGHRVTVDFATGAIKNETTGKTFKAAPFPPFVQEIIAAGGLMAQIKTKLRDGVYQRHG